jgi:7-cyano-7-deazaguanine synthase
MVVVLLSGGIDSLVCAELAREQGRLAGLVFVDYAHPAQTAEAWRSFAYHGRTQIPLWTVHAFGLALADMASDSEDSPRVVPARNALLIAAACNRAAVAGASEVWIGAQGGDASEYPDCRAAWIDSISQVMQAACGVSVHAPLVQMDKPQVIAEARRLGIERADAWACYAPVGLDPCGRCSSCRASDAAWMEAAP